MAEVAACLPHIVMFAAQSTVSDARPAKNA
jgi:hypothetical protein